MDRAYVTGASGFIGNKLAHLLLEKGFKVTCLVRSPEKVKNLKQSGAEIIKGDIRDRKRIEETVSGHSLVFHLAAWFEIGVPEDKEDEMRNINVQGTKNVLKEAWKAGVEKIVYCSTVGALGSSGPDIADERHTHNGHFQSIYVQTKYEAHQVARRLIAKGAPIIIVLPGAVYGPGQMGDISRQIYGIVQRKMIGVPEVPGILCYTYLDDVVDGIWRAAERGRIGEEYILAGSPLKLREFFNAVADKAGVSLPGLRISSWMLKTLAWFYEHIPGGKLLTGGFPLSKEAVKMVTEANWAFSSDKAERELGWRARSLDKGLPETIEWIKSNENLFSSRRKAK